MSPEFPKRSHAPSVVAVLLLLPALPAGAQWIVRAHAASVGLQAGGRVPNTYFHVPSPRWTYDALSLSVGHNLFCPLGVVVGGTCTERVRPFRGSPNFSRGGLLLAGLTWGVVPDRRPCEPVLHMYGAAGVGSEDNGSLELTLRLALRAEWQVLYCVTPAVEVEFGELGYAASLSVGIGRWFAFGR